MKIIRPTTIGDAQFVSSNITEDDYPVYSAVTTYAKGDRVIVLSVHLVYESVVDSNLGNDPLDTTADPAKWVKVGATNRWSMFTDPISRQSSVAEEIVTTIAPGRINAIAFFNLDATEIELTLTDPVEGVVYTNTIDLNDSAAITDWYSYFFEPITRKKDVSLFDLPAYGAAELEIRVKAPGGTAKCGRVVVGLQKDIGLTKWGAQFSIINYSSMQFDSFGNYLGLKKPFAKRANCEVWIRNNKLETIRSTLDQYRDEPLVWSTAQENYEGLTLIYGIYKDVSQVIRHPQDSMCLMEIWGFV